MGSLAFLVAAAVVCNALLLMLASVVSVSSAESFLLRVKTFSRGSSVVSNLVEVALRTIADMLLMTTVFSY